MMKNPANRRKHSRRKGWGRRLLALLSWVGGIGLVLILATSALGLYAYQTRVKLVNARLEQWFPGQQVSVRSIEFAEIGKIKIEGLSVRIGDENPEETLAVPEILLTYNLIDLRATGKFDSITLDGARISIDETTQTRLEGGGAGPEQHPLFPLSYFTGELRLIDASWDVALPGWPRIRGRGDVETRAFGFDGDSLSREPISGEIRRLTFGEAPRLASADGVRFSLRMDEARSLYFLDSLELTQPVLNLSPQLLEFLLPRTDALEPPSPAWPSVEIGRLLVTEGRFRVEGFDGSREGSPRLPDLDFSASFDWEGISYAGGRIDSSQPVELELKDLDLAGGEETLLRSPSVRIEAESLGRAVHDGTIDAVIIDEADLRITDDSLSRWKDFGIPKGGRKPFHLGTVEVQGGSFHLADFAPGPAGEPFPLITARFDATLQDISSDDSGALSSGAIQFAGITDFSLIGPEAPSTSVPLLRFPSAEISLIWDRFRSAKRIERLTVTAPEVRITDRSLGGWSGGHDKGPQSQPEPEPVIQVSRLDVQDGAFLVDTEEWISPRLPQLTGRFSLRNEEEEEPDLAGPEYRLQVDGLNVVDRSADPAGEAPATPMLPLSSPSPTTASSAETMSIERVHILFTAEEWFRERKIRRLRAEGGLLHLGESLDRILGRVGDNP